MVSEIILLLYRHPVHTPPKNSPFVSGTFQMTKINTGESELFSLCTVFDILSLYRKHFNYQVQVLPFQNSLLHLGACVSSYRVVKLTCFPQGKKKKKSIFPSCLANWSFPLRICLPTLQNIRVGFDSPEPF